MADSILLPRNPRYKPTEVPCDVVVRRVCPRGAFGRSGRRSRPMREGSWRVT